MLDKKTFKDGINKLLAVFPNWKIKCDDPEVMQMWYGFFSSMEQEEFTTTIHSYIENEKTWPTVAGLMEHKPQGGGPKHR